jgi:uncharacterized protein involved in outer membrane biogenesis
MKRWFILIGILAVLFIGGYFVLTFYAVKFIQPQLQKVMGPGLTLAEIKVKPTYLSARGIRYEDPRSKQRFLQIDEVRIYPSLFSLLKKSLRIREFKLFQPSFFFFRSREGDLVGPWVTMEKERKKEESLEKEEKTGGEPIQVQIDRIRIQKGSIDFEDRKVGEPPAQIKLRELDFEIRNIRYPLTSLHSPIELKGKMKGRTQEGSLYLKGWVDAKTMGMQTSLKIREIEVKTFEPYYRKRVTAEIESGYMDMDSKITVKEKRIDAPGELDLINLHVKEGGGMVLWIPAETLVSLLEKKGHQIKVKFHVKGNMDDPKFNLQETFLTRIAISFAEALGIPIKIVGETVFEGSGKGMEGLVEGLKSIEELFKKKKEKKR